MRKSYIMWALITSELVIVYIIFFVAFWIRDSASGLAFFTLEFEFKSISWMAPYLLFSIFPLYLFRFNLNRHRFKQQLGKTLLFVASVLLYLITLTVLLKEFGTSRAFLAIFGILLLGVLLCERFVIARIRRYYLKKGYDRDYILVVGTERHVTDYIGVLKDEKDRFFEVSYACYLDRVPGQLSLPLEYKLVSIGGIAGLLREAVLDEVHLVSADMRIGAEFEEIIRLCSEHGIVIRVSPLSSSGIYDNLVFDRIGNKPAFTISYRYDKEFQLLVKRLFDVVVALVALTLFSPVMFACSIAVALSGRGPVIFKGTRVGMNGRSFHMYKYRTMKEVVSPNEVQFYGPFLKINEDDPRITKVGRVLRKLSLDELPQLVNVLKGDLSLVGPRPLLEPEARALDKKDRKRFRMRPGITGLWQISGRSDTSAESRIKLDIEYVENWSMLNDFKILLRTVPAVVFAKGAK